MWWRLLTLALRVTRRLYKKTFRIGPVFLIVPVKRKLPKRKPLPTSDFFTQSPEDFHYDCGDR